MFTLPWHQTIANVLEHLPKAELLKNRCYFGGGTALVFQSVEDNWSIGAEYRHSDDIDFLCTADAFLQVHRLIREHGISVVTGNLRLARDPRIDQYGIRAILNSPNSNDGVRFEIVCDAALQNHTPGAIVNGVTCLSLADSTAHKLMANTTRWPDRASALRDYIDLIAIAHQKKGLPPEGVQAAFTAFGETGVKATLCKAHDLLRSEGYIQKCQGALRLNERMTTFLHAFALLEPEQALAELVNGRLPPGKSKWPQSLSRTAALKIQGAHKLAGPKPIK